MKCEVCGEWYPSRYYFKGEVRGGHLICNDCHASLLAEGKTDLEMREPDETEPLWGEKFDSWRESAEKIKWWTFASSLVLLITGYWRRADYPRDTNSFVWMLLLISFLTTPLLILLTLPRWQSLFGFLVVIFIFLIGMAA